MQVRLLSREDPLEEDMAIHCSILVRQIPWTEDTDRLQSWSRKESDITKRLSTHSDPCEVIPHCNFDWHFPNY